MLNYHMPLYRPPSEGPNLIIQATLGCSYNQCTFCSMYRSKTFTARPLDQVLADIDQSARQWPDARRVFLADGDALVLPTEHLIQILDHLHEKLPRLTRVSSYALPGNLRRKSADELRELRSHGLSLIYYGIESGSAIILKKIRKGATPAGMIEGLNKAHEAGIKVSATVILGLGGKNHWQEHIDETAKLVNQLNLNYLSTLQLGLEPIVEQEFYQAFSSHGDDDFAWQTDQGMLHEQARLIAQINPDHPVIFRSNHASNALPLKGTLPNDLDRLLNELKRAEKGEVSLVPDYLRGY